MRLIAVVAASIALVPVGSCAGPDEPTPRAKRVDNEQALGLIRSCKATAVLFGHDRVYLTLEDGRHLPVVRADRRALSTAATSATSAGCDLAVAIE